MCKHIDDEDRITLKIRPVLPSRPTDLEIHTVHLGIECYIFDLTFYENGSV